MSNKEKYNELIAKKQFKEACLFALDISEQELPKSSFAAKNIIGKAALAIKLSGNDTFPFYIALGIETPNYQKAKGFVNSLNFS
ncbi:MAG: hypothetical protein WBB26_14790 [Saprospiraceae bacterium]